MSVVIVLKNAIIILTNDDKYKQDKLWFALKETDFDSCL